jgi:hypothetical protein
MSERTISVSKTDGGRKTQDGESYSWRCYELRRGNDYWGKVTIRCGNGRVFTLVKGDGESIYAEPLAEALAACKSWKTVEPAVLDFFSVQPGYTEHFCAYCGLAAPKGGFCWAHGYDGFDPVAEMAREAATAANGKVEPL